MPKIDPVTGCSVMTLGEFAAQEGKTVSELLEPVYAEFERECAERREAIQAKPMAFFNSLELDLEDAPKFVEVAHVESVSVRYSFRSSSEGAVFHMLDDEGKKWRVNCGFTMWDGTRLDPPEYEPWLSFDPL